MTLSVLHSLLLSTDATTAHHSHLLSLLNQRSLSLLSLQSTLSSLSFFQDLLSSLSTSTKGKGKDASGGEFLKVFNDVLDTFEKGWEEGMKAFDSWELLNGAPTTTQEEGEAILQFLTLLLSDPYTLGAGIVTLEGPLLTSLLVPPHPPLTLLIKTLLSSRGPDAILSLSLGAFETAIREIVGRESSSAGSGTGTGGRVRELESFLVEFLEVLDGFGIEVGEGGRGRGPLKVDRGTEDILLDLLERFERLPRSSSSTSCSPSQASTSTAPTSWGSTAISTISTISSYSAAGLQNVASYSTSSITSVGSGLTSVAGSGFKLLSSSNPISSPILKSDSLPPSSSTSKPQPRFPHPRPSSTSSTPSWPSRLPPPASYTPLQHLLTLTSTHLLHSLTPTSCSKKPLPELLLTKLLQSSFPLSSSQDSSGHRKVILIGVVRWWGFCWLGRRVGRLVPGRGGEGIGVILSTKDGESSLAGEGGKRSTTGLLDEVFISEEKGLEVFLALHRMVYGAVTGVCGFALEGDAGREGWEPGAMAGDGERRELKAAARGFVNAWSGSGDSNVGEGGGGFFSPFLTPNKGLRGFSLKPSELGVLIESFSELILMEVALGPTTPTIGSPPMTSFKRASAFGGGEKFSSFGSGSGSGSGLRDRLTSLISVGGLRGEDGMLFFVSFFERKLCVDRGLPRREVFVDGKRGKTTTTIGVGSPTPTSSRRMGSGWISPPHSPRFEQLSNSLQANSNYFGRSPSPSVISISSTSKGGKRLGSEEIDLVRRALISIVRGGGDFGTGGLEEKGEDVFVSGDKESRKLVRVLEQASGEAEASHDFHSFVVYSQALTIVKSSSSLDGVLDRIIAPLKEANEIAVGSLALVQKRLGELEVQRRALLDLARSERGVIDDLRIRAWYSSFREGEIGLRLGDRLRKVYSDKRSMVDRLKAKERVLAWATERGNLSFSRVESLEESLMLVETTVEEAMEPSTFFASSFWERERKVLNHLVEEHSRGTTFGATASFAETIIAGGTSILTAPLALAGLPYPSFQTQSSSIPSHDPPANVILSFGATSPSLLKPNEGRITFVNALDEHLLRLTTKLTSYIWSDVSSSSSSATSPLVERNEKDSGRPLGSDSWFEEFASPISPLERDKRGRLPKAYQPKSLPPPEYMAKLLKRFSQHPSPSSQLHTILEIERVVASSQRMKIDPVPVFLQTNTTTTNTSEQVPSHLQKLAGLFSKRLSMATSPIVKLLEKDSDETEERSHPRDPSCERPMSPQHDSQSSSVSTIVLDDDLVTPLLPSGPFTTDDLLAELEEILKHVRPRALFQNLQIVGSLTPSKTLNSILGKAFWDVALAALSVRKEVVEGNFGLVERALTALGEGTEEGKELAERLILIASKEESPVALQLLGSLGSSNVDV